jgi:hypothetical protein
MRYRRFWAPSLSKHLVVEVHPGQCRQGHVLDQTTLYIGPWSAKYRARTYGCRACYEFDRYTALWRPRPASTLRPLHWTTRSGKRAVVWGDGSVHIANATWSNMALRHHQRQETQ